MNERIENNPGNDIRVLLTITAINIAAQIIHKKHNDLQKTIRIEVSESGSFFNSWMIGCIIAGRIAETLTPHTVCGARRPRSAEARLTRTLRSLRVLNYSLVSRIRHGWFSTSRATVYSEDETTYMNMFKPVDGYLYIKPAGLLRLIRKKRAVLFGLNRKENALRIA